MIRKNIFLLTFLLFCFSTFSDNKEKKQLEEKKSLIIIGKEHKFWTAQERRDSINWLNVEKIVVLKDSAAIMKYGIDGQNGVFIITYKKNNVRSKNLEK